MLNIQFITMSVARRRLIDIRAPPCLIGGVFFNSMLIPFIVTPSPSPPRPCGHRSSSHELTLHQRHPAPRRIFLVTDSVKLMEIY